MIRRVVVGAILIALTLIALSPLLRAQDRKGPPKAPPPSKLLPTPAPKPPPNAKAADKGAKAKEIARAVPKTAKTAKGKPVGAYAVRRGALLAGRICYVGPAHRPWTLRFYSQAWRLWLLYDPNTDQWFFWSPRLRTYLPLSLLLTRTPPLQPANVTPDGALSNTVPIDVSNVPVANGANVPNVPNVPRNVRADPLQ